MVSKVAKKKSVQDVLIYQAKSGAIEIKGDFVRETIWATLQQMADLFETDKSGISRHIHNIFQTGELDAPATVAKIATVQKEGDRAVERMVEYYNLDVILSVGYRVNSKKATVFRQWATKTLREHITHGFTINRKQIGANYDAFMKTVAQVQSLLPAGSSVAASDAIELMSLFAETWLSLGSYDKGQLPKGKPTKKSVQLTADRLHQSLTELRTNLIAKEEATDMFCSERHEGAVAGIVGNVMQSFGGQEMYPSVEEKAAHLLYFMVKNHPFTDGNKRSGAYAFIWFLKQAKLLDVTRITPPALTALTIVVAESDPTHKDRVIALILNLISRR